MSSPVSLTPLADPMALARLQVLIVPVHRNMNGSTTAGEPVLTESVFDHWATMLRKHETLRGDEIVYASNAGAAHRRGEQETARARFLPSGPGGSMSRGAGSSHVQLGFPSQPPPKHLYPLSLLRMTAFPLAVIGIAVDDSETDGYTVPGQEGAGKTDEAATTIEDWAVTFAETLASIIPESSAFPLVKRLMLVPSQLPQHSASHRTSLRGTPRASYSSNRQPQPPQSTFLRHAPAEGGDSWVSKFLGEVIGDVFGELGAMAASLESATGILTLAETLLPTLSNALDDDRAAYGTSDRRSLGMLRSSSLPAVATLGMTSPHPKRTLTPGGRQTTVQGPSAPPIQSSAIAPAAPTPTTSLSSNPFRRSVTSAFHRSSPSISSGAGKESKDSGGMSRYTTSDLSGIAGGRLLKLLGDMYLLTGMYGDAVKCYDEGAERSRVVGDVLWEGLAREGRAVAGIGEAWEGRDGSTLSTPFPASATAVDVLSHYLSSLACLSRSPLPYPPTILSPSPQKPRDSMSNLPPITTTTPSQTGTGEGLLAYLYATLCIRISYFTLVIFAAGGWGSIAVSSLIARTLPRSFPALSEDGKDHSRARSRRFLLAQLGAQSQLTRHSILGHAEVALGAYCTAMTKPEQLAVFTEVIRVARWLGMERKEAAALRSVIKLLGAVVVEGRDEHRRLARSARTTDGARADTPAPVSLAMRRKESTDGNSGIMELVGRVCAVLGVDLLDLSDATRGVSPTTDDAPHFGWPSLQTEMIKEAITIAEGLPDQQSVVRLCLSALSSLHPYLSPGNQAQLAKLYPQAIATLHRRAIDMGPLPWWLPGRMVLCVEIAGLAGNKIPFEHARAEIAPEKAKNGKDPFLYNPRLKAPEPGKTVLVANEQVDIFVTLQNVFGFDLDIQDLSLLTSGSPFITNPLPLVLPASSVQTVRVTGMAPQPGTLEIRGAHVRLVDGSSADFIVPLSGTQDKSSGSKRQSENFDTTRTKRQGLGARKSMLVAPDMLPPLPQPKEDRWIECNVVEQQPLLWIKKTSLSHGTVMLYDGESSVIRLTLENSSQVPVDFIKLSFDDSVTRESQALLADGELSPQQAYELDYDITKQPVFSWDNTAQLSIPPGGQATVTVKVLGKVGCTDGTISIDYGYVHRSEDATTGTFYTRRLTYPVLFTVYRTLESYGLDLASMRSSSDSQAQALRRLAHNGGLTPRNTAFATSSDEELRRALAQGGENSVLVCLNVRNVFSVPFEVALTANEKSGDTLDTEDEPRTAVTRLVPPGATERLVLPIPRQSLSLEQRSRPIPSVGRQYVVDKHKRTAEEVQLERETFWCREHLFNMVSVSWREPGSLRAGTLSLRSQALTAAHLDAFRLNEVVVSMTVTPRGHTPPQPMDFVDLEIKVTNHLERTLRPFVRLEALPTSSSDSSWSLPSPTAPRRLSSLPANPVPLPKTVAFDGVLGATLPALEPGQSATHTVGAILLASGSYTFRAAAEEVVTTPTSTTQPPQVRFSPSVTVQLA